MFKLNSSITELHRVGKTTASLLKKLGLETIHDLLFYFPFRYDDFSQRIKIAELQADSTANVQGTIELIQNKKSFKRRLYLTEALISDDSGSLKVIWFNQAFLTRTYHSGDKISLAGKISEKYGQLIMISPISEKIYSSQALIHTQGLVANYHLTAKLTQKQIRFLIFQASSLAGQEKDWLPIEIRKKLKLLNLQTALQQIHFPKNTSEIKEAQQCLGFAELFLRQLKAQIIKQELKTKSAWPIKFQEKATQEFVSSLPFQLTNSQRKSAWQILKDLEHQEPMNRLLEGDVGSGKTLVVILAILNVALNKKQAVLMVPTEILAQQHFSSISKLLKKYNFKITLLTHNHPDKNAAKADIIIGTQALIQDKVKFNNLALVVVDEQHRFGVNQRQKIMEIGKNQQLTPHFLSLTATPIPRSLALAIYGDLDLSIIDELPLNRQKTITKVISEKERAQAYNFIRQEIKAGYQAFVVCPVIDPSDKLGTKSVKEEYKKLSTKIFPKLKIGLLHGKLKPLEKEKIMADFLDSKIQILVTTSVIEVGIDVPNATLMLIEGAERFGLAQLHQFRGRISRGSKQSYCFLFPSNEEVLTEKTKTRLQAMEKYHDGFRLAKIDLELRGAGEVYGTDQSGFPELQIASLFDYANIKKAQIEAEKLISQDPELKKFPVLKEKLQEWGKSIHLE